MIFLKVLLGIGVAVAGGLIGLYMLMYLTVAGLALFAAVSLNKAFFTQMSREFGAVMPGWNAEVLSFIILGLIPIVGIGYLGRRLIDVMGMDAETFPVPANAILGSGFALAIYVAVIFLT